MWNICMCFTHGTDQTAPIDQCNFFKIHRILQNNVCANTLLFDFYLDTPLNPDQYNAYLSAYQTNKHTNNNPDNR